MIKLLTLITTCWVFSAGSLFSAAEETAPLVEQKVGDFELVDLLEGPLRPLIKQILESILIEDHAHIFGAMYNRVDKLSAAEQEEVFSRVYFDRGATARLHMAFGPQWYLLSRYFHSIARYGLAARSMFLLLFFTRFAEYVYDIVAYCRDKEGRMRCCLCESSVLRRASSQSSRKNLWEREDTLPEVYPLKDLHSGLLAQELILASEIFGYRLRQKLDYHATQDYGRELAFALSYLRENKEVLCNNFHGKWAFLVGFDPNGMWRSFERSYGGERTFTVIVLPFKSVRKFPLHAWRPEEVFDVVLESWLQECSDYLSSVLPGFKPLGAEDTAFEDEGEVNVFGAF